MAKRQVKRTKGAIAYLRVSTEEQAKSGLGMEAQRKAIRLECERRGLQLIATFEDDGVSAKKMENRPGLQAVREAFANGEGDTLLVAKLDRLSRSVHDIAVLMKEADRNDWAVLAADGSVDMTTINGRMMTHVLASIAEFERDMIGDRTRQALAAKRAQGVKLGRPALLDPATAQLIVAARDAGSGWSEIARRLVAEGVPTATGGRWHPATVRKVYLGQVPALG